MQISDLKVGDVAYVLSGRQNSFFPVEVTARDDTGVQVYVEAKREHQWYYNNGLADAEADEKDGVPRATLVPVSDYRIKVLKERRIFKRHHQSVQEATSAFRQNPSPENGQRLTDVVMEWRSMVLLSPDQNAVRADSIPEWEMLRANS